MQAEELLKAIEKVVDERKGQNITILDVRGKTTITDYMVLVTGTSERHARSLCEYVAEKVKELGVEHPGFEGQEGSEWILLDLGDVILHVMTAQAREFYQLEKLWSIDRAEEAVH
ncbi:ribosome silencing factor [Methylomarinum vadi]|uniref:ribosome silencing factor n=1 Tax=Methylomarinum vadi TaxID=438855 RepID=UPI0004DF121E|nr:ribosome silencing factor [Methylomarinum vadi]